MSVCVCPCLSPLPCVSVFVSVSLSHCGAGIAICNPRFQEMETRGCKLEASLYKQQHNCLKRGKEAGKEERIRGWGKSRKSIKEES